MSMSSPSPGDSPILADELAKEWRSSLQPSPPRQPEQTAAEPPGDKDGPSPKIN